MDQTILQKVNEYFYNNESTKQYLQIISVALDRQKPMQNIINEYSQSYITRKRKDYFQSYTEIHHIIPRSVDTSMKNHKPNWVILTGEEHFIVHKLLVDMCIIKRHYYSMCIAFDGMCKMNKEYEATPEEYALARKLAAEAKSITQKGMEKSDEARRNISISKLGKKRKPFTEETLRNMSSSKKGKKGSPHTEESKLKIKNIKSEPVESYIIVDGKEIILDTFNSAKEAGEETGVAPKHIGSVCNGNVANAGCYNLETKKYNEIRASGHPLPNKKHPTIYKCRWRKV